MLQGNLQNFYEELRLTDLTKHAGISDFTNYWKNERQKIKGAGNKSEKLIKLGINKKFGWITFYFLAEPTYTFKTKATNLPSSKLHVDNLYTQKIRILNFFDWAKTYPNIVSTKQLTTQELKEILWNANIQVSCDCPAFWWQGVSYNLTILDGSIYPNNIKPKRWNKIHGENGLVCKHLTLLLQSIRFWLSPMSSMLNKYLKNNM